MNYSLYLQIVVKFFLGSPHTAVIDKKHVLAILKTFHLKIYEALIIKNDSIIIKDERNFKKYIIRFKQTFYNFVK